MAKNVAIVILAGLLVLAMWAAGRQQSALVRGMAGTGFSRSEWAWRPVVDHQQDAEEQSRLAADRDDHDDEDDDRETRLLGRHRPHPRGGGAPGSANRQRRVARD